MKAVIQGVCYLLAAIQMGWLAIFGLAFALDMKCAVTSGCDRAPSGMVLVGLIVWEIGLALVALPAIFYLALRWYGAWKSEAEVEEAIRRDHVPWDLRGPRS